MTGQMPGSQAECTGLQPASKCHWVNDMSGSWCWLWVWAWATQWTAQGCNEARQTSILGGQGQLSTGCYSMHTASCPWQWSEQWIPQLCAVPQQDDATLLHNKFQIFRCDTDTSSMAMGLLLRKLFIRRKQAAPANLLSLGRHCTSCQASPSPDFAAGSRGQ